MKSDRTKALDITKKVKDIVWERDMGRCILCGTTQAMPNAHYIPRSQGGLGIEENIVTLCIQCHHDLDQTTKRAVLLERVESHLQLWYPDFRDKDRTY